MQRAEGPSSRLAPEPTPTRPSVSPPVAFLLLAVIIAILGAIVLLTRPETPATPTTPNAAQQPDFSLTNEEAITRFEELNASRVHMYELRDVSFASEFLAPDSPLRTVAETEVQQLLDDGVLVEMNFDTVQIKVVDNSQQEITIRQTVIEAPVFSDENGKDVTRSPAQRRVVEWTLVLDASVWKLDDLQVLQSREIKN